MPDDDLTPRDRLRRDRERAAAECDQHFADMTDGYALGHATRREAFVRREQDKGVKEIEERQLQAIPAADRRGQR